MRDTRIEADRLDAVVKSAQMYEPDLSMMRDAVSVLAA
jgi:hypothetical protein